MVADDSSVAVVMLLRMDALVVLAVAWLIWSAPSRRMFRRAIVARWSPGVVEKRKSEILDLLSISVQAGRPLPAAPLLLSRLPAVRLVL